MYRKYVRKFWLLKRNGIICPEEAANEPFSPGKSNLFLKLPENRNLKKNQIFRKLPWKNQNFSNICLQKSKFFENLPGTVEVFWKFAFKNRAFSKIAWKIRNFSKICLEKSKFCWPESTTPRFQTRLTPLFVHTNLTLILYIHGDSIKCKPNCLCHIYFILDLIMIKLSRYLDNSTRNMISTQRTFGSIDKKIWVFEDYTPKISIYEILFRFCNKVCLPFAWMLRWIYNIFVKKVLSSFCFLIELKKMFEMSSFCLPQALRRWSHWAIAFSIILWSIAAHTPDV